MDAGVTITRNGITYRSRYDALGHPVESGYGDGANYRALARLGVESRLIIDAFNE